MFNFANARDATNGSEKINVYLEALDTSKTCKISAEKRGAMMRRDEKAVAIQKGVLDNLRKDVTVL